MSRVPLMLLAVLLLALVPVGLAHQEELRLVVSADGPRLVLTASSLDGYPIQGAKFDYRLIATNGQTQNGAMREEANGVYALSGWKAAAGAYTLVVRDTTFPGEATESKAELRWPLVQAVQLELPPTEAHEEESTATPDSIWNRSLIWAGIALLAVVSVWLVRMNRTRVRH